MTSDPPLPTLAGLSVRALLRLYADILTELVHRGVLRSRNAPVGDLAEHLVARALGGDLAPASAKSYDVEDAGGRHLQVKARLIVPGDRRSHNYSPFRSFDFAACVFVLFDAHTYDLVQAVEVPAAGVQALARETAWVNGFRVSVRTPLLGLDEAVDRTAALAGAFAQLDRPPQPVVS